MGKKLWLFLACMLMTASMAFAQQTVTGVVTDAETGDPLIGASVRIPGTSQGVVTDANGKFTLAVPANTRTLQFSYMGMRTVNATARNGMKVSLESDSKLMDDVMIVAYGTATRSSFTGSAAVVGSEVIENNVATNVTSALAGTAAGVQFMSSNGDPTSNEPTIRIRGIGSLSASNNPLYVVDGVPYDGSINTINPQDVESMTVLKDASATAIYGARGANGVILINTKKGKKGQHPEVKFDAKWGSNSRLIPNYDVITDPGQYYEEVFKRLYNGNITSGYDKNYAYQNACDRIFDADNGGLGYQVYTLPEGQNLIGTNMKLNPNAKLGYSDGEYFYMPDNWYDNAFHSSFRQEYNATISGASDKITYYASGGYLQDGGIVSNSSFKRYNGRLNAQYQANDWLRLSANMNFTHTDSDSPSYGTSWGSSGNMFYIANNIAPIYPLYVRNADGSIAMKDGRVQYDANQTNFKRAGVMGNAIRDNEYQISKMYNDVFSGDWSVTLTPVKGLTVTGDLGILSDNARSNYLSSVFGSSSSSDGYVSVSHSRLFSVNARAMADYKTDFGGSKHNLDVLVGYEQYRYKSQGLSGSNTHLYDPFIAELNNAKHTTDKEVSSSTSGYMTEGILSRAQYDYAGKYFVDGSYRRDASSRFAPGHRWGNFGSVGLGWVMNKEKFLKSAKWINFLKLKLSYGIQGNDNLLSGEYPWTDMYTTDYNEGTGQYSITIAQKGNENLTWETSHSWNAGVDFSLFGDRLYGNVDFFNRKTTDMLFYKSYPLSVGYGTSIELPTNIGSVRNWGVEIELGGKVVRTKNVEWDLNLNMTHFKNRILELDPAYKKDGIKYSYSILREGGSVYETYMYKFAGIQQTDDRQKGFKAGDALYYKEVLDKEGNPTGELTVTNDASNATKMECGSTLPKLYGGFGTTLKFKGFDLGAQFSYQLGGKIYDGSYQATMWTQDNAGQSLHKDIINAWSPENTGSNIPRWDSSAWGNLTQSGCDYFLTSSNYLSIHNVTFGYSFPKNVLEKLHLGGVRIYVAGENLALFSARKGLDPRFTQAVGGYTSGAALNTTYYSAMRTITGGITINF
ncbi:MAG: TonB-dependent receptor [Bacteroidales bacterium]|nr:TonB-dependent receptor [Candidatus Physcousia equi]